MDVYKSPDKFWEERLKSNFDLTGVGYKGLGPVYNNYLYQARINSLIKSIIQCGITFENQSVFEIGPGTGFFTNILQQFGVREYIGVDITKISVDHLTNKFPDYRFIKADIGGDEFDIEGQFDIILAADVLYHIVEKERFQKTIHRIGRLLHQGGHLIVADVFYNQTELPSPHVCLRSMQEYQSQLNSQNLDIIHIEPIFAVLHPPAKLSNAPIFWKMYSILWHIGLLRLANYKWVDNLVPKVLGYLDQRYFLKQYGLHAPNNKWMIAQKKYVG